jgi:zinc protease
MRRNSGVARLLAALGVLAVLGACTSSSSLSTTGVVTTAPVPSSSTSTEDPRLSLALPLDPEVTRGRLDNGLSYYIRYNDSPGGRAELRLLVDAGSVQEDPDQAGMAHFLEHMMFNGTRRFPRNALISVLESFGPRFGPDINAYTTFDETVYELSLSTADPELVPLGIDVLREWATEATLTETDVREERGVILDEWRLRAQGFDARVDEQLQFLLLEGSDYEGHDPIGTDSSISATEPAELERFYDDWYHPGRMTVVAVGDFDVAEMESLIVDAFGDVPSRAEPRRSEISPYPTPERPRARTHLDAEATLAGVSVLWARPAGQMTTVGDYQTSLATQLGLEILADRLNNDALSGTGPLLGAVALNLDWTRGVEVRGIDTEIRPEQAEEGLNDILVEVERLRRHGIGAAEFERAVTGYASYSQQFFEQQESAQDLQFAVQIAAHHLAGDHMMGPDQMYEVESAILDRLTVEDLEMALEPVLESSPMIMMLGPDEPGLSIPDEAAVLAAFDSVLTMEIEPRSGADEAPTDLMTVPDPVPVTASTVDPDFGYTTLTFANGATVYLWESDIATRAVHARIEGFGGTSQVDLADLPEAFLATQIVNRSGVGDFDIPTLRRALSGRIVGVDPWITETRQGLEANSSSSDVETLFQLIHLTMTEPRFDPSAFDAVIDETRSVVEAGAELPALMFEEALSEAYYGDDPRYFVLPDAGQLAEFDRSVAEHVYRERFGNAGHFAFAFVGDFDSGEMAGLAARYIGTLPGSPEPGSFVDNQPLPPREVQVRVVEAGTGQQGQIGLFFTNPHEPTARDRLAARLVELIVTARLRERVREELSATYSISVLIDLQRDPDPFAESYIISTGDPAGLEVISEEIIADLALLRDQGPTPEQFETGLSQLRNEIELLDNSTLAQALVTAYLYPDQPVVELTDRYRLIEELTPDDVTGLARIAFDPGSRIEIRQVPAG